MPTTRGGVVPSPANPGQALRAHGSNGRRSTLGVPADDDGVCRASARRAQRRYAGYAGPPPQRHNRVPGQDGYHSRLDPSGLSPPRLTVTAVCRSCAEGGRRCPGQHPGRGRERWRARKQLQRQRARDAARWQAVVEQRAAQPGAAAATFTDEYLEVQSLDQITDLIGEHANDEAALERLCNYLDRLDRGQRQWAEWEGQQTAADAARTTAAWQSYETEQEAHGLAAPALRPSARRQRRLTATQRAREDYDAYVADAYLQAETDCRGCLLTREAQRDGISPYSLFSGQYARVKKYGSPELREWFGRRGRLTWAEFRWQALGRQGDRDKAWLARHTAVDEWSA